MQQAFDNNMDEFVQWDSVIKLLPAEKPKCALEHYEGYFGCMVYRVYKHTSLKTTCTMMGVCY